MNATATTSNHLIIRDGRVVTVYRGSIPQVTTYRTRRAAKAAFKAAAAAATR